MFELGALFFLYVGAENAFGGWIASYAKSLVASLVKSSSSDSVVFLCSAHARKMGRSARAKADQ